MSLVVQAKTYGGPEVLEVVDVPTPDPAADEVVIDVRAVGTNPIDFKLYSGAWGTDPSRLPMPIGSEASGVVSAAGADASGPDGVIGVGDEVIVDLAEVGAYAAQIVAKASEVFEKPSGLGFEEAAGLLLTSKTATHLIRATDVHAGDTVLIHGASGGVGFAVAQLAILEGAKVIGTAGPSHHEELRAIGVVPVSYGDGLRERVEALAPGGITAALDTVGTDEALDTSVALVADRSRIATIAGFVHGAELGVKILGAGEGSEHGAEIRAGARQHLIDLAGSGKLKVVVAKTLPLTEAAEAHRLLAAGHAGGKIILIP